MGTITKDQKQAVRWMLDGLDVEARIPDQSWEKLEKTVANDTELGALVRGAWGERWEFRLKPRTVKIGSREVEAPVLELNRGDPTYIVDASGTLISDVFDPQHPMDTKRLANARLFASPEAAQDFHDAITALLRGEA